MIGHGLSEHIPTLGVVRSTDAIYRVPTHYALRSHKILIGMSNTLRSIVASSGGTAARSRQAAARRQGDPADQAARPTAAKPAWSRLVVRSVWRSSRRLQWCGAYPPGRTHTPARLEPAPYTAANPNQAPGRRPPCQ